MKQQGYISGVNTGASGKHLRLNYLESEGKRSVRLPADNWFIILKFATIARRWRLSIPGLILVQITGSEYNGRLNVSQGVINGDRLWCRREEVDHGIEGSALSKSSTARMFLTENPPLLRGCEATSPSVESMLERSSSTFDCTVGIAVFGFSPNCRKACMLKAWRVSTINARNT